MSLQILSVVGARPQFIKAAPVSLAISKSEHSEYMVHTGQHYDFEMSGIFFEELNLPPPKVNLNIGSGSHGTQTGKMLMALESVIVEQKPDVVVVYGDTNSTIAAALATVKLGIPLAHVEAGLRSFNREMPEEHNRVLTDHASDILLCPTPTAIANLEREGMTDGVYRVGDTMKDTVRIFGDIARETSTVLETHGVLPKEYILATVHRPYNTDDDANLTSILRALEAAPLPVIFPAHPRAAKNIQALRDTIQLDTSQIRIIAPLGYMDMLKLLQNATVLLTDSGGMQKEAFFCRVRCITLRPETEWVETLEDGWNTLTGADFGKIQAALAQGFDDQQPQVNFFGDGRAAQQILQVLEQHLASSL